MVSPTRPRRKGWSSIRPRDEVLREAVRGWIEKAHEDLDAGGLILAGPMRSYGVVSFLAQQAAEKALKALLIGHQVEFDKTHNLEELLRLAEGTVPGIRIRLGQATELTPFAVTTRYPGGSPPIDRDQAAGHLTVAREVVAAVEAYLRPSLEGKGIGA